MNLESLIARGEAVQDQEIAAGVEWIDGTGDEMVKWFFDQINDGTPESLRRLKDAPLQVLRSMAMIGMFEVVKAHARKNAK